MPLKYTAYLFDMETIDENNKEYVIMYATYTILYSNDMACNCIRELEKYTNDKDKETRKIYGALRKRVKAYLRKVIEKTKEDEYYYADYLSYMDKFTDRELSSFFKAIRKVYKCNGLDDSDYLAKVEVARAITDMSVYINESIVSKMAHYGIPKGRLDDYKLQEMSTIINHLSDWVVKVKRVDKNINLNDKISITKSFDKLRRNLLSLDSFEKSIGYAISEFKKEINGGTYN